LAAQANVAETHADTELATETSGPVPAKGDDPFIGRTLVGKYRVDSLLGVGAMGKVYRAEQLSLSKPVAVKVLHRHLMSDEALAKRFHREAKSASTLNHPNSIQIIDFGQAEDGSLYIAMELLAGRDLGKIIRKEFPLPPERVIHLVAQVLSALDEAHAHSIIHRDLKPENIMVVDLRGEKDLVKVCDFGIAKVQDPKSDGGSVAITMAGLVCGTPEYMSPEQARGEKLDGRSDLYSVGIILYQMVTGAVPFHAESALGIVTKHLVEAPIPPRTRRPELDIHPALEALILRAMSKEREGRPADATAFRQELLALRDEIRAGAPGGSIRRSALAPADANVSATAATAVSTPGVVAQPASASTGALAPATGAGPEHGRRRMPAWWLGGALLAVGGVAGAFVLMQMHRNGAGGGSTPAVQVAENGSPPLASGSMANDNPVEPVIAPNMGNAPPLAVNTPPLPSVNPTPVTPQATTIVAMNDRPPAPSAMTQGQGQQPPPQGGSSMVADDIPSAPVAGGIAAPTLPPPAAETRVQPQAAQAKVQAPAQAPASAVVAPPPPTAPKPRTYADAMSDEQAAMAAGDHATAIARLKEAIKLDPSQPEPYKLLGRLYYDEGDPDTGNSYYKQYLKLNPNDPYVKSIVGQ
jgi:tRNA A-37 threonylcarbamoyl transferase component Bud32